MSERTENRLQKSGVVAIVVSVIALVVNCVLAFTDVYSADTADFVRSIIGLVFVYGLVSVYLPEIEKL